MLISFDPRIKHLQLNLYDLAYYLKSVHVKDDHVISSAIEAAAFVLVGSLYTAYEHYQDSQNTEDSFPLWAVPDLVKDFGHEYLDDSFRLYMCDDSSNEPFDELDGHMLRPRYDCLQQIDPEQYCLLCKDAYENLPLIPFYYLTDYDIVDMKFYWQGWDLNAIANYTRGW